MEWSGVEWSEVEWCEVEWSGMEQKSTKYQRSFRIKKTGHCVSRMMLFRPTQIKIPFLLQKPNLSTNVNQQIESLSICTFSSDL